LRTHRPKELSKNLGLEVPPVRADPVDALEVGKHQDVQELGAGSWAESLKTLLKSALKVVGTHPQETSPSRRPTGHRPNSPVRYGSSWTRATP
jgi:hypothetical protein